MSKAAQNVLAFAEQPAIDKLFEKFAQGKTVSRKEADMAEDSGMGAVANALERLSDKIDGVLSNGNGKRRGRGRDRDEDDGPESAREMGRGRGRGGEGPLDIQGVLFQVKVPVGRRGETMPGYLLFPPVRDERELEELAEDVERRFKMVSVYQPKGDYGRGGGNGYGRDYGRDRYDRDRDRGYDRDRR